MINYVYASMALTREITHVDELDGVFRVRFDYIKEWKDHNLKFKNLHENIVNSVRHGSLNTFAKIQYIFYILSI